MLTEPTAGEHSFGADLQRAIGGFRAALSDLFAALRLSPTEPQELARQVGLDKSLAWKLCRVLAGGEPTAIVPHMPGAPGMKTVLDRFSRAGAPAAKRRALQAAYEVFERVVATHAGDRSTLLQMTGGKEGGGASSSAAQMAESQRRMAFRGNSGTLGVTARMQFMARFVVPNPGTPKEADFARVSGLKEFRRLRGDVAWTVSTDWTYHDDGSTAATANGSPIDSRFAKNGLPPLMGDFCSQPLPELRCTPIPNRGCRFELVEGDVGRTAATTCVLGWHRASTVPTARTAEDKSVEFSTWVRTPVEKLVCDLFMHRDIPMAGEMSVHLISMLDGTPPTELLAQGRGLLPLHESLEPLGTPPDTVVPDMPEYSRLTAAVFDRYKWDPSHFRGYRLAMKYPPLPSALMMRYELP